jgi:hypothetical protein
MGKVQRQVDPDEERHYWERKIEKAISIYTKLHGRNSSGRFLTSILAKQYVHKQPKNYHHKVFRRIIETLEILRAENTNPFELMLEDYLICLYEYYGNRHKRVPHTTQLVPTEFTMGIFQEWIAKWEEENDQPYWINTIYTMEDIAKRATDAILASQRAHVLLVDQARSLVTGKAKNIPDLLLPEPIDAKLANP